MHSVMWQQHNEGRSHRASGLKKPLIISFSRSELGHGHVHLEVLTMSSAV